MTIMFLTPFFRMVNNCIVIFIPNNPRALFTIFHLSFLFISSSISDIIYKNATEIIPKVI